MSSERNQYCTFHVHDLFLGINVQQVQEVIRYQKMTTVPLAPEAIKGLINLRGQIVTAIDLRCKFGLPPRSLDESPMNVVVRDGENAVSLLVDRIGDVVELEDDRLAPSPSTVNAKVRNLLHGVHKLPVGLMLVLDTDGVLNERQPVVAVDAPLAGQPALQH